MTVRLKEVTAALEAIAPLAAAESWDNVGLIVGDAEQTVERVLLCIDYTAEVAAEAERMNCQLIVAYHPPLFEPIKRLTASSRPLLFDAVRKNLALYSPHTALDVAPGGTNDVLADVLGLTDRKPLKLVEADARQFKLATTVPPEHLEKVADAVFAAGGGGIGHYTRCSFRYDGTGTFRGDDTTHPAVGRAGEETRVGETKFEVLLEADQVVAAVAAIKASHPYEVPAIDLHPLTALPTGRGIGRVGNVAAGDTREAVIERIKAATGLSHLLTAGPTEGPLRSAACCAGAGGGLLDAAIAAKADLYLTGELRHHDALKAVAAGITVVATLHSNSERLTLGYLADALAKACPSLTVRRSQADRDPFRIR